MTADFHHLTSVDGNGRTFQLVSHGNVTSVLQKARASPRARKFAELLRGDPKVQAVFFHHWRQVSLLKEASIPLFICSDAGPAEADPLTREAQSAQERFEVALPGVLADAGPLIEKKVKTLQARLKASGVDFESQTQEQFLPIVLGQLGLFTGGNPINGLISMAKPFEDYVADEVGDFALELLSAIKSGVRAEGMKRRKRLMAESGLSEQDYEATLGHLRDEEFLRPVLSVLWCKGHAKLPVTSILVGDRWQASPNCQVCRDPLLHCTFLVPAASAMMFIRQYEGILPYLLSWDLEQNEIPWAPHVYLEGEGKDTEKDIVYRPKGKDGVVIVECKSVYTDTPDRTVETNLKDHLGKLAGHVTTYQSRGIRVERAVLATNYQATEERRSMVDTWVKEEREFESLRKQEFTLVGPNTLRGWWK